MTPQPVLIIAPDEWSDQARNDAINGGYVPMKGSKLQITHIAAPQSSCRDERLAQEFLTKMQDCDTGDEEVDHSDADDVLLELLVRLGYPDVVEAFNKIEKWYA